LFNHALVTTFHTYPEPTPWWLATIPGLVQSVSQLVALTDAAVGFANGADGEAATLTMIQEMAKELRGHRVPFLDRDTEPHPPRESLRFAKRLAGGASPPSEFVAKHIEAMKAAIRARIEACSLGWEVATIALMEAIEIVMAVADREGGARILDSVADWLSNQLVPADVEICTFADMATMHPSEMADIGMVCFEIGRAGELDETWAAASAKALLTNVARYPRVQNMLSIRRL
jgi:hypothetical protein